MLTRGMDSLRKLGIQHTVLPYDYQRSGALPAAEALELDPAQVVKSLVFHSSDGSFLFALLSADAHASEKKLGRASGHKHVHPASTRDAERVTGYRVGGISPLGAKRVLPVILDRTTAQQDELVLNAGERGVLVRLATVDLVWILEPVIADIRAG